MTAAPTRTWLVLVALTLAAMWAGGVRTGSSLGFAGIAVVIGVSGVKAAAILRHFLELRRAPARWQAFFYGYLVVLGALIFAAYAVGGHVLR